MLKLDIAGIEKDKGKTFHVEADEKIFVSMKLGDVITGKDISKELNGYEFVLTGASDNAGFPALASLDVIGRKRLLLVYGKGMRQRKPRGLRLRKTVRGNTISADIAQINLRVKKQGEKPLSEIYAKKEEKAEEAAGTEQQQ